MFQKGNIIKCDNCNKTFFRKLSTLKRNKHNFCNRECYEESKIHSELMKRLWINPNSSFHSIVHNKKISIDLNIMTPAKAYIFGVLCGDGYLRINKENWQIGLKSIDKEFVEFFAEQIKSWLGEEIKIHQKEGGSIAKFKDKISIRKPFYVTVYCSMIVVKYLKNKYGDFKTKTWRVPKEIMNSDDNNIIGMFLRGFFDSEGSIDNWEGQGRICFYSINLEGLKQIQQLLEKIGIKNTYFNRINNHNGTNIHSLRFGKSVYKRIFFNKIRLTINRKREKLSECLKHRL